jgi:hypothetical protein
VCVCACVRFIDFERQTPTTSLSLSLSHTHTHTHTYKHSSFQDIAFPGEYSFNVTSSGTCEFFLREGDVPFVTGARMVYDDRVTIEEKGMHKCECVCSSECM